MNAAHKLEIIFEPKNMKRYSRMDHVGQGLDERGHRIGCRRAKSPQGLDGTRAVPARRKPARVAKSRIRLPLPLLLVGMLPWRSAARPSRSAAASFARAIASMPSDRSTAVSRPTRLTKAAL